MGTGHGACESAGLSGPWADNERGGGRFGATDASMTPPSMAPPAKAPPATAPPATAPPLTGVTDGERANQQFLKQNDPADYTVPGDNMLEKAFLDDNCAIREVTTGAM